MIVSGKTSAPNRNVITPLAFWVAYSVLDAATAYTCALIPAENAMMNKNEKNTFFMLLIIIVRK
jgi:hypothetical protein